MAIEDSEGNGGVYLAMMLAGTIDVIGFVVLYITYSWWLG